VSVTKQQHSQELKCCV